MNSVLRVVVFLAASLLVSVQAISQAPLPPYGHQWQWVEDSKLEVKIGPHGYGAQLTQSNQKVSGTNVEFRFSAALVPPVIGEDPGEEFWTTFQVVHMKVWIGGHEIGTFPGPPADDWPYPGVSRVVRFASTKFPDGSVQELKVEGLFRLSNPIGYVEVPLDIVVPVLIYNKVGIFATKEDYVNPPGSFQELTSPGPMFWSTVSKEAALYAISFFQNSLNHGLVLATGASDVQSKLKSDILSSLDESTFLFYATHGSFPAFTASVPGAGSRWIGFANLNPQTNEVTPVLGARTYTYGPNVTPHHNMAILYACSVVPQNKAWFFPMALMTASGNNAPLADRCVAGFSQDVYSIALGKTQTFKEHAEVLLGFLNKGLTIDEATKAANDLVPLIDTDGKALSMLTRGDPKATIKSVYGRNSTEIEKWYLILQ